MLSRPVLIAETDPRTLEILPRILSDRIPHIALSICTSASEFFHKLKDCSYGAVAMNAAFLHDYTILNRSRTHQTLAPIIVTASQKEGALAHAALEGDAFDLIVKPIVPLEAVLSVRVALWQSKLLRLFASKDRAAARFRQHMEAFPHAVQIEQAFLCKLAAYERTLQALNTSIRLVLDIDEECSLFDMAALVERLTKERAMDRLFTLCQERPFQ